MLARLLDEKIKAICPIDGVSIGRLEDRTTWRIDFKKEATISQRAAAQTELNNFDVSVVDAEKQRQDALDSENNADAVIVNLKKMTNAEIDAWFTANITNAATAIGLLKKIVKVLIRLRFI